MQELIESGSFKQIKSYITRNKDLASEKFGPNENSILMEALEKKRDYDVIKLLLEAGASPKAENANGDSAVTMAAKLGADQKILDALISYDTVLPFQRKNRILKENDEGLSALDYAKQNADQAQMETINHYLGIVDVASAAPKAEEVPAKEEPAKSQETAEAKEAPVEETAAEAAPAAEVLQVAAAAAAARVTKPYKKLYLFEGIEAFDTYNAAEEKKVELIPEPNKQDKNGRTLLHKAASQDDIEKILLLKDSGADFCLADNDGYTPLMYAARFAKKIETVAILLSNGASAKERNKFGLSAVEIAAADNKNPEIVAALLAKSQKEDVKKAYVTAVGLGRPNKIIQKFFDAGMSPNMIYKGKSVLMYAAESNTHTDCIKLLLEKGADSTMLTSDWKDAFWFARQNPSLPKNDVYWSLNNSEKN
ncbi:MAG: ankyrin repeat domain-containing protein [Treponema sp.]|nr:ankyrin repeat domain-containing protein [Treponema sp.]